MSRILLISINKYCYWLSSLICFATFQKVIERQYMKYVCIYIYIIYIYIKYIYKSYICHISDTEQKDEIGVAAQSWL